MFELIKEISLGKGLIETIYMVGISTIIAYIVGFPMGVYLVLTDDGGLFEHKLDHKVLNIIVNIGRAIPFIIVIVFIVTLIQPLGVKTFGPTFTILPLSLSAICFVARIIEQSLKEVDKGVIEASYCMGASIWTIIFKVYFLESLPSIIRGISLTMINLIGYSAMAGAVGGGGLGNIAITYGYYRFKTDVMIIAIIVIILLIQIIQVIFDLISKKIDRR